LTYLYITGFTDRFSSPFCFDQPHHPTRAFLRFSFLSSWGVISFFSFPPFLIMTILVGNHGDQLLPSIFPPFSFMFRVMDLQIGGTPPPSAFPEASPSCSSSLFSPFGVRNASPLSMVTPTYQTLSVLLLALFPEQCPWARNCPPHVFSPSFFFATRSGRLPSGLALMLTPLFYPFLSFSSVHRA